MKGIEKLAMKIMYTLFLSCMVVVSSAQISRSNAVNPINDPPCASDQILENLLATDPEYALKLDEAEARIQAIIRNQSERQRNQIYTIPIVVHIMHEGEAIGTGSNISDEQIYSAVVALNEDFRKVAGSNGDGNGVDVEMEFCLAVRDPNGLPTSGITRTDASIIPLYAEEGIKSNGSVAGANETDVKALANWPHEDYINVWIVNEIKDNDSGSGVQGYAYFPTTNPNDGIVVMHNAFGTVGNLKFSTDENRVFTHEMGHCFKLYHTFHQTNDCDPETNCLTQGDRVCDTPKTIANGGCFSPACSGTQQVENYMDYTPETCMDMFTQGQKDRMRATLLDPLDLRFSLLSSLACTPLSSNDVGVEEVVDVNYLSCPATTDTVIARVRNYGSDTCPGFELSYFMNGEHVHTELYNTATPSGEFVNIPLYIDVGSEGLKTLEISVDLIDGLVDELPENNNLSYDFEVVSEEMVTVEITTDYFGTDTYWNVKDEDGLTIGSGGPYANGLQGTTYIKDVCLKTGCYYFSIYDVLGDGMTLTNGDYRLIGSNGNVIASYDGEAFSEQTTFFCVDADNNLEVDFGSDTQQICVNEMIDFIDESTDGVISWNWLFEGAVNPISTDENPTGIQYNTPGVYDVSLTVSNGITETTITKSNYITVGLSLSLESSIQPPLCFGQNNGSIDISILDPEGIYTYVWSNGSEEENITGLASGDYSVTISNEEGCVTTHSFSVEEPAEIDVLTSVTHDLNNQGLGEVNVTVSGGTPPYTYVWTESLSVISNSSSISDLLSGIYILTVSDANGCQALETIVIENNNAPIANFNGTDETCANDQVQFTDLSTNDPTIYAWVFAGGTPSASSENNPTVVYSQPGTYSVALNVTSLYGTDTKVQTITVYEQPVIEITSINHSCENWDNGSVSVSVSGGVAPYAYEWNNGQDQLEMLNLPSDTYTIIVTDENNCTNTQSIEIESESCVGIQKVDNWYSELVVYPNPFAGDKLTVSYPSIEEFEIYMHDLSGREIALHAAHIGRDTQELRMIDQVSKGLYFITVRSEDEVFTKIITAN